MEDYYEYLDSNGVTTLYKLIKDDTVALIDSYSVTINGITTNLDNHINSTDIHTPITDIENMVDTKISGLVNSAPETLDTLKELSDALGNDPNFATTVANQIGHKASKDSVYTKEETNTLLEGKANSIHTHVTSDITDFPTIPTKTSELINDSGFLTSSDGLITSVSWSDIINKPNFSTVATSGSYTDLSNTPTIPTKVSQLENDTGFINTLTDVVDTKSNQTINGTKTFTNDIFYKNNNIDLTTTPSSDIYSNIIFTDKNSQVTSYIQYTKRNTGTDILGLFVKDKDSGLHGLQIFSNNYVIPLSNNTYSLGASDKKWANVHATTFNGNWIMCDNIRRSVADSYIYMTAGPTWNSGASVFLNGKNGDGVGTGNGTFLLYARDGTDEKRLLGYPNGILSWNGCVVSHEVRSTTKNAFMAQYDGYTCTLRNDGSNTYLLMSAKDGTPGTFTSARPLQINNSTGICNINGHADSATSANRATKASHLDNYSLPGMNKIYMDWDNQVRGYVGLKVDNTTMGGLITTNNIGSQSVNSAIYSTTPATTDNSTRIATTAWVRTYVDSVAGSNTVGSSVSAYWSNSSNVTATGQTSASGTYPACYSEYITKTPTVGTIYSGAQLYTKLAPYASATASTTGQGGSIKVTNITAQATFSNPISSTGKYLCTTANTVKFRAYVTAGSSSSLGTASVVNNSSTKSIFIRVQ